MNLDIDFTFYHFNYNQNESRLSLNSIVKQNKRISSDLFQLERTKLINEIYQEINDNIELGMSKNTVRNKITIIKSFFHWCDLKELISNKNNLETNYKLWANFCYDDCFIHREFTAATLYNKVSKLGSIIDAINKRGFPILNETRVRKSSINKGFSTVNLGKQNLEEVFNFGKLLISISNHLTTENINGRLPAEIPLPNGNSGYVWCGLYKPNSNTIKHDKWSTKRNAATRDRISQDTSYEKRAPLINLRIFSEIFIFISQTGMNLSQAYKLKKEQFVYYSHLDGYQVKTYKNRRNGQVEFTIFSEYKIIFERYLKWLDDFFPNSNDDRLFPILRRDKEELFNTPCFTKLKNFAEDNGYTYISCRKLRKSRINWFLRRSKDLDITSEIAQHSKETLIKYYEEPNLQFAMVEINNFHLKNGNIYASPGPGNCINPHNEKPINNYTPVNPDCSTPAGCLFCANHRDINSEDYIWSLLSYRHLKSIEYTYKDRSLTNQSKTNSISIKIIERITEKIDSFRNSSMERELWTNESMLKIQEGYYHPSWEGFIFLQES